LDKSCPNRLTPITTGVILNGISKNVAQVVSDWPGS